MSRATNSPATRRRRKRAITRAKGFRQSRGNLFKQARVTAIRGDALAYSGRRQKKRLFRALWITRLTAAVKAHDMNYSRFIHGVQKAGITLNRKDLSVLAIHDPATFTMVVDQAKAAIA